MTPQTTWEVVFFNDLNNWETHRRNTRGEFMTLDEARHYAMVERGYWSADEADQIKIVEVTRTVV